MMIRLKRFVWGFLLFLNVNFYEEKKCKKNIIKNLYE